MSTDIHILLTNDDGIESPGLRRLYDALSSVGTVTAVAPRSNQSAVGRSMSERVEVKETELGYAIDGTPADCVVVGLQALVPSADLVVSGVNFGANLGTYALGRSGTISAAVEASFFDVPAIAASLYIPESTESDRTDGDTITLKGNVEPGLFSEATRAVVHLVEAALDSGIFETIDYLNVNAPSPYLETPTSMEITAPSSTYLMDAEQSGQEILLVDRVWTQMSTGDTPNLPGTDRQTVLDGDLSVSPLAATHSTEHHESLDAVADSFRSR